MGKKFTQQRRVRPDGDFPARYVSEQRCRRCGMIKGFEDFYRTSAKRLGSYCKPCHIHITTERQAANPEEIAQTRLRSGLKKYGLTLETFTAVMDLQAGVCAICRRPERKANNRLSIDHDHNCCDGDFSCGECVRGLLCDTCNRAIALFDDDPTLLRAAATYLEERAVSARAA